MLRSTRIIDGVVSDASFSAGVRGSVAHVGVFPLTRLK